MTPDFKAARERFEANWQWDTSDPKEHVLVFDPDLAADWAWKHKDTIRTALALAEKVTLEKMKISCAPEPQDLDIYAMGWNDCVNIIQQAIKEIQEGKDGQSLASENCH